MKQFTHSLATAATFLLLLCTAQTGAYETESNERAFKGDGDWIQFSVKKKVPVTDGIDMKSDIYVAEGLVLVEFHVNTHIEFVKCCRHKDNEYAWCDRNYQDSRC